MRKLLLAVGFASLALPVTAQAHFNLLAPPSSNAANATEGGKGAPPCGPDGTPSNAPIAIQGGQMFTLKINETVFHPGFYRVALALHSRSELPADPVVYGANDQVLSVTGPGDSVKSDATAMAFPVLANNLFSDHTKTGPFEAQVKIPNVNCSNCTLQVIEFMAKHGPNPGGGYFYHHCADLKITADQSQPIEHGDGAAGAGNAGGGAPGSAGSGGAAAGSGGAAAGSGGAAAGSAAAGSAAAGSAAAGSGGVGGVPAAAAGAATAGAPTAAGASAAGASAAGASSAGSASAPAPEPADDGGCSLSHRAAGSAPLLSLLLGLFALGRRRNRRR